MQRARGQKVDKCVSRDIQEMATRGTFQSKLDADEQGVGYEPRFLLAYKKVGQEIGVVFFDVTTLQICVGQFVEDDESL